MKPTKTTGSGQKKSELVKSGERSKEKERVSVSTFDPYHIIKYPLSTEKSIRQIEFENKLVFVVDGGSTKAEVKRAVEELFQVKVMKVNVQNSFRGEKRAYVKLTAAYPAADVSADLGLI